MDCEIIDDLVAHIDEELQNTHRQFKEAANEMILDYIKKYHLLVYGYYAFKHLNLDLQMSPVEDNLYYKCYSGRGSRNVGDLIKNLKGLGYYPIMSKVTHTNYASAKCRIVIGRDPGITIIEITTVNPKEYSGLQKLSKCVDDLLIVNPLVLRINALNNIFNKCDWENNYSELITTKITRGKRFIPRGNMPRKIISVLSKRWNDQVVFTGDYVFTTVYLRSPPQGTLSIVTDPKTAKLVADDILSLNNRWTLSKYQGTIDLVDRVLAIKDGKKVLLRINICVQSTIPYVLKNDLKVANYLLLLKYYSSLLLSHELHRSRDYIIDGIKWMINETTNIRNKFLSKKKLIGTENRAGIFKIFCNHTIDLDSERVIHNKILWEYKRTHDKEEYANIKRMCEPLLE